MSEPIETPANQENTPGNGGEITFTQAQVDALISKEKARAVAKATKGMPDVEELNSFRAWRENQKTEAEKLQAAINERDTAASRVAELENELEKMKHVQYLASKGLVGEEAEFISFKAEKLVSDKTTFESAVDTILAGRKEKPVFSWSAPLGGSESKTSENETMNALIRGIRR